MICPAFPLHFDFSTLKYDICTASHCISSSTALCLLARRESRD